MESIKYLRSHQKPKTVETKAKRKTEIKLIKKIGLCTEWQEARTGQPKEESLRSIRSEECTGVKEKYRSFWEKINWR